ncbi:DUF4394 domain-containing protein [Lentzea flaviverrucosa]|uniref:DUF4394 domain-containing protein n=1 Tax=Lentzea flaviverrucosa TaxID=200379 RepID=A0A1H8ZU65_9PSEU|nr:DUF4394 domain-containing protein [Lentzea flaviverrucosa]RDI32252.1 uncharacterized protein DUF4394 [Lentzea flaviverrucosa]SEP67781.1 protein of unknown function [Lentzea flaviverrucosa]
MRIARTTALAGAAALLMTALAATPASASADQPRVHLLTSDGVLSTRSWSSPLLSQNRVRVTGLKARDRLIGMDVRPATGALYAIAASGQLYVLDPRTGKATAVGAPVTITGTAVGIDFNPVVDRIRLVTTSGQNLRLVPDTAAVAATDTPLAYAPGDRAAGSTPQVSGAGYTNSVAGATSTTLYDLDSRKDALVTQGTIAGVTPVVSPNTGQLFTVGRLGIDVGRTNGFDIATLDGRHRAMAAVQPEFSLLGGSLLVKVDLDSGRASVVGFAGGTVVGLAFA